MARVIGSNKVVSALQARAPQVKNPKASVVVGYTQNYAIHVHENLSAYHPVGQAKFLEQPARELQGVIADIVRQALQQRRTIASGLLLAGLRLQRESQKLCPVDTGALKNSAFTRLET